MRNAQSKASTMLSNLAIKISLFRKLLLIVGVLVVVYCVSLSFRPGVKTIESEEKSRQNNSIVIDQETNDQCMEIGKDIEAARSRPALNDTSRCVIYDQPSEYMNVLTEVLIGLPIAGACKEFFDVQKGYCEPPHRPVNLFNRRFGNEHSPYSYSMIGRERMDSFRSMIAEVNRKGLPGAIMEFGVWRGGAMIMAAAALREANVSRDLYLFDAFAIIGEYSKYANFLAVPIEKVKEAFSFFGLYNESCVHFVKGLFNETTTSWINRTDPVAVLRVDGNFYDSYEAVMYALYENVPVGGFVIFDDIMSHSAVLQFWIDFKKDHGLVEDMVRLDKHSAWFRKTVDVKVDQTKRHFTKIH